MTETLTPDPQGLARAARLLSAGGLVAFPTETVYGLGGDARSDSAVACIFAAKGRPRFNPLIVHVGDLEMARTIAVFDDCAARATVSSEWRPFKGSSGAATAGLIDSVRAADLVIASQPQQGNVSEHDSILFEGGRPILFIPWIDKQFKQFKRVLIAWDGSRGVARSTFDSLSLLHKATEIEIFTVDARDSQDQPADLASAEIAASLSRHGLNVTTRSQASEKLPISAVLENRCSDFGADLMIMGAYGTSRIMERIFGGVTHVLLESMTVPVLMSR